MITFTFARSRIQDLKTVDKWDTTDIMHIIKAQVLFKKCLKIRCQFNNILKINDQKMQRDVDATIIFRSRE